MLKIHLRNHRLMLGEINCPLLMSLITEVRTMLDIHGENNQQMLPKLRCEEAGIIC